jgi:predicted ester cyclase
MNTEQIKSLVRRVPEELYNQGTLAVVDEVFAPNYIEHTPLPPDFPHGVQAVKTFVTLVRTAFPDFRYTIADTLAEGDKVVFRLIGRGTHQADFMGIPATGKPMTWEEIHICRIVNDKLVEHWVNGDLMQQLMMG